MPGLPGRTLLAGTILTATGAITGEVLVVGSTIECVEPGNTCSSHPDAAGATRIETQGVISPGLIDTHNHILFDVFDADDWAPIMSYQNHDQWTNEPGYHEMLDVKHCLANDSQGKPAWCAATVYGTAAGSLRCEMDKWGELKGLVSGTTSIVGLPGTSAGCFGQPRPLRGRLAERTRHRHRPDERALSSERRQRRLRELRVRANHLVHRALRRGRRRSEPQRVRASGCLDAARLPLRRRPR